MPSRFGDQVRNSRCTRTLVAIVAPFVIALTFASGGKQSHASTASLFELVSGASDGGPANGDSFAPALSADGRFVAFESGASNLVPGDTNRWTDVLVRDLLTGVTTRESVGPGGIEANGPSFAPHISADGRFVAFISDASNLVPGVTGSLVYVRDRQSGVTYLASASTAGIPPNAPARDLSISRDGRFVGFSSQASNLVANDTNQITDIFVRDLSTGITTRESVAPDGTQVQATDRFGFGGISRLSMSGDARYLAFTASNTAPPGGMGSSIIVRDRVTAQVTLESIADNGLRDLSADQAKISDDGRYVLFKSIEFQFNRVQSVLYLRDRATNRSTRMKACFQGCMPTPQLSPDGRYVSSILWDGDCSNFTSPCRNARVAVLDRATQQFIEIPVAAVGPNGLVEVTPITGVDRAFAVASRDPLVATDTNGKMDVFLVRFGASNVPGPPANLSASVTASMVTVTWTAPVSGGAVTAYVLEAGSSPGSADLTRFAISGSTTTLSASGVSSGTYYLRVKASNGDGSSLPSNELALTVR